MEFSMQSLAPKEHIRPMNNNVRATSFVAAISLIVVAKTESQHSLGRALQLHIYIYMAPIGLACGTVDNDANEDTSINW